MLVEEKEEVKEEISAAESDEVKKPSEILMKKKCLHITVISELQYKLSCIVLVPSHWHPRL